MSSLSSITKYGVFVFAPEVLEQNNDVGAVTEGREGLDFAEGGGVVMNFQITKTNESERRRARYTSAYALEPLVSWISYLEMISFRVWMLQLSDGYDPSPASEDTKI